MAPPSASAAKAVPSTNPRMPPPVSAEDGRTHIIIVGAGIIGVCTAYYLTRHPQFSSKTHKITIIESTRPASGASGKAGGLLALWAFPSQLVPLSFKLHEELAEQYNGADEWAYRRLQTVSLEGNLSKTARVSKKQPIDIGLPEDLDWVRSDIIESWSSLSGKDSTAQVHPYKFTMFMLRRAQESGAVNLVLGKVLKLNYSSKGNAVESVVYAPVGSSAESSSPESKVSSDGQSSTLKGDKIVVTVGPWTSRLLPTCPVSGLRAHSITITPSRPVSAYALFTELKVAKGKYISPEIYARKDEVYICGEGDNYVEIPDTTDDVEVLKERCEELVKYAGIVSEELQGGRITRRQACYLPVVDVPSTSGPLIGPTNSQNLYVASGHSCWGINNAPGTGKIMAEILLEGEAKSADVSSLDPRRYFVSGPLPGE
ncbi:FAD dependent oxidoreductase [Lipomyces doorenjongii]|uniref:FAD dependent oxidoreductase n=1 Tax=Lipomyces doorenjongii TaxID=383834 RepID=UPI0034CF1EC9